MAYYPPTFYGPEMPGADLVAGSDPMGDFENQKPMGFYGAAQVPPQMKRPRGLLVRMGGKAQVTSAITSLLVPWLLYCAMYWVMSFRIHYDSPSICWTLVALGFVFVAMIGKLAIDAIIEGKYNYNRPTHWYVFLAVSCLMAWFAGVSCGDSNFFYNMNSYYNVAHLAHYGAPPSQPIDPSMVSGKQVMDAGIIDFTENAVINRSMNMVFKSQESYCVAPIMTKRTLLPNVSYDFWVVGLNCCSGTTGDFQCGEYLNPKAHQGLRLLRDDQREYYRLAVKQAEAAYRITAAHPLFFYWLQDTRAELREYEKSGKGFYYLGVLLYFLFQALSVIFVSALFRMLKLQ